MGCLFLCAAYENHKNTAVESNRFSKNKKYKIMIVKLSWCNTRNENNS